MVVFVFVSISRVVVVLVVMSLLIIRESGLGTLNSTFDLVLATLVGTRGRDSGPTTLEVPAELSVEIKRPLYRQEGRTEALAQQ